MRKVGILADSWGDSLFARVVDELRARSSYEVDVADYFHGNVPAIQNVWESIRSADVVIACISKNSRNIYYEIGLAHGFGKPVILVVEDRLSIAADLAGQRIIRVNLALSNLNAVVFQIVESVEEILNLKSEYSGFKGPREEITLRPDFIKNKSEVWGEISIGVRSPLQDEKSFHGWFTSIAKSISGWEVIEPSSGSNSGNGFDFIVWNSINDQEFIALGNPIAVEVKIGEKITPRTLNGLVRRAAAAGLGSLIFATTGVLDESARASLLKVKKNSGFNIIAIDRYDLEKIYSSVDVTFVIRQKVKELLYKGGA